MIGDATIAIEGTNVVISWPSEGHEYYLIQSRPTLDPSTPWTTLTNVYPANGTNRTTFTIVGVVSPPASGGGGGGSGDAPPPPEGASQQAELETSEAVLIPSDGSGTALPLSLYPPGVDLSGSIVIWPDGSVDAWTPELSEAYALLQAEAASGTQTESGGESEIDCAFFRVFHIPDWSFNVTNYTYAGSWFFPVDFKDYRDWVAHIEVLLDGDPTSHAEFTTHESGGQTNWGMRIDFDRLTNGTYQIQLVTTLWLNDEIGDNAVYLALTNPTRPIVVFNQVTFPDWNDVIQGDSYTFNAQLANPDTDWWIDIYDAWGFYVDTGAGHTTNGQVSWTWDLYDWQGYNRDDFDSDPFFFSEITFSTLGDGPQTTEPQPVSVKGYPNQGEWLIAFQDRWYTDAWGYSPSLQTAYEDAIEAIWGGPLLLGEYAWWHPLKLGTNVYTQAERENTWTNLLAWVGDLYVRNFYYYGHGGATSIGCDRHTVDTNGFITGSAFSYRGSLSTMETWQVASKTKYNRYRFVFLDGCSTAAGNWPNAFNISQTTHTLDFYENHPKHPRPSVFVGWNETVGGDPSWGDAFDRHEFQSFWMGSWVNDSDFPDIEEAIRRANVAAEWIDPNKLNNTLKIYGYVNMRARDYNRKGDWRWP